MIKSFFILTIFSMTNVISQVTRAETVEDMDQILKSKIGEYIEISGETGGRNSWVDVVGLIPRFPNAKASKYVIASDLFLTKRYCDTKTVLIRDYKFVCQVQKLK